MTRSISTTVLNLLHTSFILFSTPVYCWLSPCPANGYKLCSPTDLPETISTSTVISHCIYDSCPQVLVSAGVSLTLNSVTFKNSFPADSGSAIKTLGANTQILIQNSNFINCSATNQGGAIYASTSNYPIIVIDSSFINCSAANQGGAICLSGSISITAANMNLINVFSQSGAGIMASAGNSTITGGSCVNSLCVTIGGCYYLYGTGNVITGVTATGGVGFGTFLSVNNIPTFTLVQDCVLLNMATAFYAYGVDNAGISSAVISLSNVTFNSHGNLGNLCELSWATLQADRLNITNADNICTIYAHSMVITNSYLNSIIQGFEVTISNSIVENAGANTTGNTLASFAFMYYLNLDTVTIRNCESPNGLIFMSGYFPTYYVTLQNVLIENNNIVPYEDYLVINQVSGRTGILYFPYYGSAQYSIFIGSNVTIQNNKLGGVGAAIYINDHVNITFQSDATNIRIRNNTASSSSDLDYLAIIDTPQSFILGNLKGAGNEISGAVYIASNETAKTILNTPDLLNILPSSAYYTGPASYLTITPSSLTQSQGTYLYLSQPIPTINVTVNDYFGGMPIVTATSKFVIINVVEARQGKALSGETIKGVFSTASNPVSFELGIKNLSPGNYTLTFSAINTVKRSDATNSTVSVNLNFLECNPVTEIYVPGAKSCYSFSPLATSSVLGIGGFSLFSICILLFLLAFLMWRKRVAVAGTGAYWYLTLIITGSAFCALSFLPHFNRANSKSCMDFEWLYNIGFSLVTFAAVNRADQLSRLNSSIKAKNIKNTSSLNVETKGNRFPITNHQ